MVKPHISIVIVGRNDNYGGDFRSRLQRCVSNTFKQLTQHGIHSELIFVNYNPVEENAPIENFIDWPTSTQKIRIRIITISNAIHRNLVKDGTRKDVPVLEYLGKNAGIRRAQGEFILSMNPDIIMPSELVKELKNLRNDTYYRADRIDFEGDIDGQHQLLRFFVKGHDHPIRKVQEIRALRIRNFFINRWKLFTPRIRPLLNYLSKTVYYDNIFNRYHCNVSGDFMLMHRDHWNALNGHNEQAYIALHVDSLMVMQAAITGLREFTYRVPIFHQAHTRRYDATRSDPIFDKALEMLMFDSEQMIANKRPKIYNGTYWGLSKFDLPEINP